MKFILILITTTLFLDTPEILGVATYYKTHNHPKIHRPHSTAAYYRGSKGLFFKVTNVLNNKCDTVEITDYNAANSKHQIDLKFESFYKLTGDHSIGKIKVKIKLLSNIK